MDENKNWSEISKELNDLSGKLKNKLDESELMDDLKKSLTDTVSNTNKLLKKILSNLEEAINDEAIKRESMEMINVISAELKLAINSSQKKLGNFLKNQDFEWEEE